ncbi:NACHT, LRR and PYD domains-containing protein 1 homolog isoform X2 [Chanodichthys erythropterus]|uniref:NACHT, LRR and PYD domains-containing protein 1 homolog isoform X2 n=1 Tax=Chanodichthys erythropterus TaxID=933992 RepID=UPI00351F27D4
MSDHGVRYVDRHRSELIQRVQRVMAVTRKLLSMNMINVETYSQIRRAGTKQDRMRKLYVALDEGGHEVKSAFYSALKECEPNLCYLGLPHIVLHCYKEICPPYNRFLANHWSELIRRATTVMPIVDELSAQHKLNDQTYARIRRAPTNQEQMTELYRALDEGGYDVKSAFYFALRKYEPHLFCYLEHNPKILQYKSSVIKKYKFVTEYKLPSDERVGLAARYTEPVIIQKSKEQAEKYYREHVKSVDASSQLLSNDKNHSIRIDQLFSPDIDGNTPKTVILTGDSGRGKSFMLQKIMLDWASGELYSEMFDVVFLLNCEELTRTHKKSLFELLSWRCSLTSNQISEILELTPEKVLFLIDGIDDFSFDPHIHISRPTYASQKALPMDIFMSLLNGRILSESFLLITFRTAAGPVINLLKGPQRFTEIMGFSERGVHEYFHKFFHDELLLRKTYESVKINDTLLTTCSVPLLCWMICFCLKKHFTDDDHVMAELKTTTSIYVNIVSTLLEHHGQSQSDLTMLKNLGQLAEEGMLDEQVLFDKTTVLETCLDADNSLFLHKEHGMRDFRDETALKFMHLSFQEFFVALYYVFLNEEESQRNIRDTLAAESVKGRISNPISSVLLFLCGLSNEDANSSLFKMRNWTVPYIIRKEMESTILTLQDDDKLLALRCLYELHDEVFVRRALADWVSMDLSNISLRSTDCWVLLYCLQCCPHIRELNLMYCDLTADKLKILQPALCMCETLRLSVDHLSEVGDLIMAICEFKILKKLKVQEDELSAVSPRWSLDLSIAQEDYLMSLSSSEKNPLFPAILNISLTRSHSEISNTDWILFLQTLKAEKIAEDSLALEDHVSLLLSSFHSVGLKKLDLKVFSLNESWASGIISLVQTCTSLQELSIEEDSDNPKSLFSTLSVLVYDDENIRLDMRHRLKSESLSKISFTCPRSASSSSDWKILFQRFHEVSVHQRNSPEYNEHADGMFYFLRSVCGLKSVELMIFSLNHSWALRILFLIQTCSSLQEIHVSVTGLLLEEELEFLYESLKDSHCTVIIEGPTISEPEPSGLDLHLLPVCQSCVHIVDSDQWVQVEPSVCTDEGGSKFRISTQAGRFECSRTRMRWVCAGDVTLQYRQVDGRFLNAELERLQCERIGPVIDVSVISGKLEEAHLPHYACLAESDPSLKYAVKVFSVEDYGLTFESVELTRFHARILQPDFSPKTVLMKLGIPVKVHCDLLVFVTKKNPIILHVYFFPSDSLFKEKIRMEEKSSHPIKCPRPETPLRMMKQHSLEIPGACIQPREIKLRGDIEPNFFKVKQTLVDDINMTLNRVDDQKSVWTATIWKEELAETIASKVKSSLLQHGEIQMKQVPVNFDKVSFFDNNWCGLIKNIKNVNAIADKLLQKQIINEEIYSEITHPNSTKEESMRKICSVVRKGSVAVKNLLISILQEEEPNLLNDLHLSDS